MRLICSTEELLALSKDGILKVKSKDEYYLETRPNLLGESVTIIVTTSDKEVKSTKILDTDVFINAFPTPAIIKKYLCITGGELFRNLRTGRKDVIRRNLINLSKKYTPDDVLNIIKYEVEWRVKNSLKSGRNEFQFMSAAEAWSNNDVNVDAMYQNMLDDVDVDNTSNNAQDDALNQFV